MKKTFIVIFVVLLVLFGIGIAAYFFTSQRVVLNENDVIVLERKTIYSGESPLFTLRLYNSGKIFSEGGSTRSALVSDEDMALFYQAIVNTDVMNKTCRSESTMLSDTYMDFYQKTTLTIDGNTKIISAPYCEDELNAIFSTVIKYIQKK